MTIFYAEQKINRSGNKSIFSRMYSIENIYSSLVKQGGKLLQMERVISPPNNFKLIYTNWRLFNNLT